MKRKKDLQARIDTMIAEITRRGGMVSTSSGLPLELREKFLQQVLDCPDCTREAKRSDSH